MEWLGGRRLVWQTERDLAELHYVVVDGATCAAVVFDAMWLWMMVCRERVRRQFEHPGVGGVLQETQGSRERVFLLQSRRCAPFIGNDMDATVSRYFFIFHFFVFFFIF